MKRILLCLIAGIVCMMHASSQCTSCNYTYPASPATTTYTLNNQKLCITSNCPDLTLQNFNGANTICLANGVKWTQNSGLNFNGDITFSINSSDTVTFNGSMSCNGTITFNIANNAVVTFNGAPTFSKSAFNVASGGKLIMAANPAFNSSPNTFTIGSGGSLLITNANAGWSNNFTITNSGLVNFTSSSPTVTGNGSTIITNNAGATFEHTGTGTFTFLSNNNITNSGTMLFNANLENAEAQQMKNNSGATITVGREFYNHGSFTNDGTLNLPCNAVYTSGCGLRIGNKGPAQAFTNNVCLNVYGPFSTDGAVTNNGVIDIFPPNYASTANFTVSFATAGTGRFIIENGISTMNSAGSFTSSLGFWDKNTTGSKFDVNNSNTTPNSSITVNTASNTCAATLPASGMQLQVAVQGGDVVLSWSTLTEQNTNVFIIEKSTDGLNFKSIGTVAAAGSSKAERKYSYTDKGLQAPVAYYRTRLLDIDGKATFGNTAVARNGAMIADIQVFPNPAHGQLYASFEAEGNYRIDLINTVGEVLLTKKLTVKAGQTVAIEPAATTPKGNYVLNFYNLTSGEQKAVKVELQ